MGLFDKLFGSNDDVSAEVEAFERELEEQKEFGETGTERLQELLENDASSSELKEEIEANIKFQTNADPEVLEEALEKLSNEDLSDIHDMVSDEMNGKGFALDAEWNENGAVEDKEARFSELQEIVEEAVNNRLNENEMDSIIESMEDIDSKSSNSFIETDNEVSIDQSQEAEITQ